MDCISPETPSAQSWGSAAGEFPVQWFIELAVAEPLVLEHHRIPLRRARNLRRELLGKSLPAPRGRIPLLQDGVTLRSVRSEARDNERAKRAADYSHANAAGRVARPKRPSTCSLSLKTEGLRSPVDVRSRKRRCSGHL